MRNKTNSSVDYSGGGLGLSGVLTVVFVVLKLVGVINWSWVWVLSPLWISISLSIVIITAAVIIMLLADKNEDRKKDKWKF